MTSSFPLIRRCPMLGGEIPFKYCETNGAEMFPCRKIMDCWWDTFDVERYLKDNLTAEQFDKFINSKYPDKLVNIIAAANRANNVL